MNSLQITISFFSGAALAILYFGGLWWTVDRLKASQRPMGLYLASFAIRISMVAGCSMIAIQFGIPHLIAATVGFFISRMVLVSRSTTRASVQNFESSSGEGAA